MTVPLLASLLVSCGDVTPPVTTGTIAVFVRTTGRDLDRGYEFAVGNQVKYIMGGDGSIAFTVTEGTQMVTLGNVAENCTVAGPNSVSVEVIAGKVVDVIFTIKCDGTGLEITTRTTGTDVPNNYELKIGSSTIPINLTTTLIVTPLAPGTHNLEIVLPGENCTVVGSNQISVSVSLRIITPVHFDIDCVTPIRRERIAFHALAPSTSNPNELLVANPDGSGEVRVAYGQNPAWSPDGKRIAYAAITCDWYYGCNSGLGVIDPETRSESRSLFLYTGRVDTPAWAPNDDLIAYIELNNEALFVISPSASFGKHVTIPGITRVREPSWSPDGKKIALACLVAAGNYDICVINRDGSGLVRLVERPSVEKMPAWSPDGTRIAFAIGPSLEATADIAVVSASGGEPTIITQGETPSWSRDGTKLIFARADGLYTINPDGTNLTRLTTGKHRAPRWRPQ